MAVFFGSPGIMSYLISTGQVNLDSKDSVGQTPRSWTAGSGHEAAVKLLLDSGKADVDSKDYRDRTPLVWLCGV